SSGRSCPLPAAARIISRRSGAAAMCCANPKRPRRPPSPEQNRRKRLARPASVATRAPVSFWHFTLPRPVRAELVEALLFSSSLKKEQPFDRLRANGLVDV